MISYISSTDSDESIENYDKKESLTLEEKEFNNQNYHKDFRSLKENGNNFVNDKINVETEILEKEM